MLIQEQNLPKPTRRYIMKRLILNSLTLNSQHSKKELGKSRPRLFTKNIASWTKNNRYILPSENLNGRGTLTVQR